MAGHCHRWLLAVMVGGACWGNVLGQDFSPAPLPVAPPSPSAAALGAPVPAGAVEAAPPPPMGAPAPSFPPPPAAPAPSPFAPPPYPPPPAPASDPGSPFAPVSFCRDFYVALELDILKPVVTNHLSGTVVLPDGTTAAVAVPQASLHWTVSPTFEVGAFLPDGLGQFSVSYRFLLANGSASAIAADGGDGNLRSHLDANIVDLDYGTPRAVLAPQWEWSARLGFRLAQVYFNTQVSDPLSSEETTNWFLGGGPHARLEIARALTWNWARGLAVFGRIDGAVLVGEVQQRYLLSFDEPDGTTFGGSTTIHHTETLPLLNLVAGLSYTPPFWTQGHLALGYEYEEWFRLGHIDGTPSNGRLTTNGVFLRAQVDY